MATQLTRNSKVLVAADGSVLRRDFIRKLSISGAAGLLGWQQAVRLKADELRQQGMSCILLWMQGGPSQYDTFSPKPEHASSGGVRAISTSVPGIEFSENFGQCAKIADDLCVIRSVHSKEASHQRAQHLLHTSYAPSAAAAYPTLGSHVAHEIGDKTADLPDFVEIGGVRPAADGGILGVGYNPFSIADPTVMPDNTVLPTSQERFLKRMALVGKLGKEFQGRGNRQELEDHGKVYAKASKMILSPQMDAFDVTREPEKIRSAYGESTFGQGCLLARRLVEHGVTSIEVGIGDWDTHFGNLDRSKKLSEQVDTPFSVLIRELKERGLLERTLVVWMGEFGRTPEINPRGGRDHFSTAFNVVLAGAGVRGGQVIGKTNEDGSEIIDRPVSVPDLFRTFYQGLDIDPDRENYSGSGRPTKIVDGGEVVSEVFG